MHWKTIGGKRYAYRSRRVGGKVVTEYVGSGEVAGLIALLDAEDRAGRFDARQEEREDAEAEAERDRPLDELVAAVQREAEAYLLSRGFHRPGRWKWRRRRCPKS